MIDEKFSISYKTFPTSSIKDSRTDFYDKIYSQVDDGQDWKTIQLLNTLTKFWYGRNKESTLKAVLYDVLDEKNYISLLKMRWFGKQSELRLLTLLRTCISNLTSPLIEGID